MKRKPRIRTDVPTLWLDEGTDILRIIWPIGMVDFFDVYTDLWIPSYRLPHEVRRTHYYCGPLFVSKENEP